MNVTCTARFVGITASSLLLLLGGCAGRGREAGAGAPKAAVPQQAVAHEGKPYALAPEQSLLTVLAYRGGTLARMGHNHVVASRDLEGTAYVPEDLTRASFELRVPVAKLTVDEPELREAAGPDFAGTVPDSAKAGTRQNMLSEALLDVERYPEIVLRCERVDVVAPNDLLAYVQVIVKDQAHRVTVPVHYQLAGDALDATGEFALRQSELGLTPFSVALGALQVQDEMKVRFKAHFASSSPSN